MTGAAVIVACGGLGARYRADADVTEKQFALLAGKPVLAHTLDVPEEHPRVEFIVLVLPASLVDRGKALVGGQWSGVAGLRHNDESAQTGYAKVRAVVAGGASRGESVANGLAALEQIGWDGPVLVQDGVRPCTPGEVYDRVIDGVMARGNAVAAVALRDSLKRADGDGLVLETVDRRNLWQIQTPQGFWMAALREAYAEGRRRQIQATDDAALVEALGRPVYLVEGHPANIKLTYREDMVVLEALLLAKARWRP